MSLERFSDRSLADIQRERNERRELELSNEARREFFERKTRGKLATAYCTDSHDAQALIDYAEAQDHFLDRVLREADNRLTKRFDQRHTSGSLCDFLANKYADHVILTSIDVFVDFRDFSAFVWLCCKARVKIHFLNPVQYRFWRFTFTFFN
jgi:hypothetical protein